MRHSHPNSGASFGSTSASLIERVRRHDPVAWRRLVRLYGPLVYYWCRHCELQAADLTWFVGGLKADDEYVGIELGDDGYYWLRGKSKDTTSTAMATSVLLSRERTLEANVRTYQWPSEMHRQPIRMIHSSDGMCFLSLIRGRYSTPEDAARVYIGDDGFWYLSGGGEESPVAAEAIAVRLAGDVVD